MTLGTYTFAKPPIDDVITLRAKPHLSYTKTFGGVAVVDWGASVVGAVVDLPWALMDAADYEAVQGMAEAGGSYFLDIGDGRTFTVDILEFTAKYRFGTSDSWDKKEAVLKLLILARLT